MPKKTSGIVLKNNKIWVVKMIDGESFRFSTKLPATKENIKQVENNISTYIDKYKQKKENHKNHSIQSLAYIAENILKEKAFASPSTRSNYNSLLKKILDHFGEDFNVTNISRENLLAFVTSMKKQNLKTNTIKATLRMLNTILQYALEEGFISKKPNLKIRFEKNSNKIKAFSLDQVKTILAACDNHHLKSYLKIAFFTGLRKGEILALTRKDIDFENKKIYINKSRGNFGVGKTKNPNSIRQVDMLPIVEDTLKDLKKYFSAYTMRFIKKQIVEEWFKLLDKIGFDRIPIYNTRHTFASIMLAKGEELLWVSKVQLGHASAKMTLDVYADFIPQTNKQRATFLNELKEEQW